MDYSLGQQSQQFRDGSNHSSSEMGVTVLDAWCRCRWFSFKFLFKSIDFESRAGSGAAGDRKTIDFLLNSF